MLLIEAFRVGGVKSGKREKKGDWDCWVGGILVCFEVVKRERQRGLQVSMRIEERKSKDDPYKQMGRFALFLYIHCLLA